MCLTDSALCLAAIALTLPGGQPFALNIKKTYLTRAIVILFGAAYVCGTYPFFPVSLGDPCGTIWSDFSWEEDQVQGSVKSGFW